MQINISGFLIGGLALIAGTAVIAPSIISYAQVGGGGVSEPLFPAASVRFFRGVVFASLPTCSATIKGTLATVTDSAAITFGGTVTGASSNTVLTFCDGTNWTVAGI